MTFGGAGLVVGGERFASFEVVADEFGDGGIDGCEVEDLAGEFVVVYGVECFGHVEGDKYGAFLEGVFG